MKYIILVGDGMPDLPLNELGGKTPLEAANTPNMDLMARNGICGSANFVPESMAPGSDVANLSLFGYDPVKHYTGRGPFEAASMGVALKDSDVAFRCNLVTIKENIMESYSSGHITTPEAAKLIKELDDKLSNDEIKFYPGISYRHLCVINNGPRHAMCTPPHDISGKEITRHLPEGQGEAVLRDLMERSVNILTASQVNKDRIKEGRLPANSIWLWGQGVKPTLPTFDKKYRLTGSVITAVDLIKGIGVYAGLDVINVPGATGYLDTNYLGKANYALESLKVKDFVFVHVESPDECGHNGDIKGKIQAIEDFDKLVVGTILSGIKKFKDYRVLVTADHPTPLSLMTHSRGMVPFAVYDGKSSIPSGCAGFCEKESAKSKIKIDNGHRLAKMFLKQEPIQ